MKRWLFLLTLIPLTASADQAQFEAEKREAKELLYRLYNSPEVARYCTENPDGFYAIEVSDDQHVEINCRTRNAWIAMIRKRARG